MSVTYTGPYKKGDIKKVVLAYSGGLDTSVILKWLQTAYGCEVVTFTADLGQGEELGPGAQEGRDVRRQAREHPHRRRARGVRERLRLPDVPRQRALRGRVPARHLDRPAADRQAPDRDRPRGRRRRGVSRRHRQGQRPGALRAQLLCAEARHQGDRAVARMGAHLAHQAVRVRREAPDSRSPRTSAARRRSRSTPTSCTPPARARSWRIPGRRPTRASTSAPSRPRPRPTRRPTSRSISRRATRWPSTA